MKIEDFNEINKTHKEFCIDTIRNRECGHNCKKCPFHGRNLRTKELNALSCTRYLDVSKTTEIPKHAIKFLKLTTQEQFIDVGIFISIIAMKVRGQC